MRLRREIALYGLELLMEVLSVYAVLVAVGVLNSVRSPVSLLPLLLVSALAGTSGVLVLSQGRFSETMSRALLLAVGAGATALSAWTAGRHLPGSFLVAAIVGLAYWRGVKIAGESPDYDDIQAKFGFGLGLLLLGVTWVIVWSGEMGRSQSGALALTGISFVIVSMLAMSLARMESAEARVVRSVSASVAAQLAGMFILAIVALQLFAEDLVGGLAVALQPLVSAVASLLSPVAALLVAPFFALLDLVRGKHVRYHVNAIGPKYHRSRPQTSALELHHFAGTANQIFVWLAIGLVIAMVLVLAWRFAPPMKRPERKRPRRSHWTRAPTAHSTWLAMLRRVLTIFARGHRTVEVVTSKMWRHVAGPKYPEDPVRAAYARLLHDAGARGVSRNKAITPHEFQSELQRRWPAGAQQIADLTNAYVARRYGESDIASEHVREVQDWARHMHTVMRGG